MPEHHPQLSRDLLDLYGGNDVATMAWVQGLGFSLILTVLNRDDIRRYDNTYSGLLEHPKCRVEC